MNKRYNRSFLRLFCGVAIASFTAFSAQAQNTPESFKYQSSVRSADGTSLTETQVNFQISILQSSNAGSAVYSESHLIETNSYGIANFNIGGGTIVSGVFSAIDWSADTYFVKIELDPTGGSTFETMGTAQLLSVPYALHAKTADNVDDADADSTNELQELSINGTTITISNGNSINLPSGVVDTDDQTISLSGTDLSISEGNTIDLSSLQDGTGTDNQNLSISGTSLSISDGTGVDLSSVQDGYDADTDDQTISLLGTSLSISEGNTVDLSSLQDGTGTDSQNISLNGSTLTISGGNNVDLSTTGINPLPIQSSSSNFTAGTSSGMIRLTAAATVTLPASPVLGQLLYIVGGTGGAAINGNGKTIVDGVTYLDGNTDHTFTTFTGNNGGVVTIMYNGFNWSVVSKN